MNSKRSYLDSLNAGRQRRPYASLEQLNRSLETLEQRIEQSRDEAPEPARVRMPHTGDLPYGRHFDDSGYADETRSHGQAYQSIARDIERVRGQENGVAAFGKIAEELKGLRQELSQQVDAGVRREFERLRKQHERSPATGPVDASGMLGHEFERLSGAIQTLAERGDDKSVNMLRLEIEQVKTALEALAREETVLSVDRRFDDLEHRFAADGAATVAQPGLAAIARRLEEISDAVRNLPESLSLPSLEEKVRMLASALEHFIGQQSGRKSETFGLIEERLDEISRAIVASTAQATRLDPEPFERIEARISALARQIEEVAEDRPADEVLGRLNSLAERVDEMAVRTAMPEQAIAKLTQQIASIADKIDHAPQAPGSGDILAGIEQRFDLLSSMLERRQSDALDQGNQLFHELERRLDEVADKLDDRRTGVGLDGDAIMGVLDTRFSALAQTIESRAGDGGSAISGIESRLEDISAQLDASAAQLAGIDPGLIRNLEAQVAALSAHLSRPGVPLAEFEDIGPRLDEIEKSIAGSRESVLEAAREAAETAARSLAGSQADSAATAGLAKDLKTLESLTRRSDERNGKTFEAIHDTLLKIVERLASLESETVAAAAAFRPQPAAAPRKMALKDAPSIDPDGSLAAEAPEIEASGPDIASKPELSPAQAAAAAAIAALGSTSEPEAQPSGRVRSMLGGLSRAFTGKKEANLPEPAGSSSEDVPVVTAPEVGLDAPLDPKIANRPLEPGSGAPDLNAIMKRVRDERGQPIRHSETDAAKSDFIAAARRAAQAAAAEADALKRGSDLKGPVKALRIGDLLKSRRKPILMATAAMAVALGGLQLGKAFMSDTVPVADSGIAPIAAEQPVETASLAETPKPATVEERTEAVRPDAAPAAVAAEKPAQIAEAPAEPVRVAQLAAPQTMTAAAETVDAAEQTNSTSPEPLVAKAILAPESAAAPAVAASAPVMNVPAEMGPAPLREAANAGDVKALFEVGSRYAEGRGVAADKAEAAKWYRKSADLGFAPAQFRIGNFYEKGLGVERDIATAKDWYLKAAAQGNASAMHNLAVLFAMGADGAADNEAAARWFIAAAELGVKDSQFNLGILAAKGLGMPQDLEESYKWFALVAETGDKDATAKRDEVAGALRPEQLERARAATELWKPKPLDQEANSAEIPDTWHEGAVKTDSLDMTKAIQNIQLILGKNGYQVGKPDGLMGAKTRSAIVAFQKDNDMKPTGKIDEKLVRALLERK